MLRYWRAANYLTVAQIYLQENPLLREPLRRRARQAAAARPLGYVARPQLDLRPPEPADQRARCQRDLPGRPGPRRPGVGRPRLPRGHLLGGVPGGDAGRRGPAARCAAGSRLRAAFPATSACRRRARSTRAANWATCCPMPSARRSTTPTCSSPRWSGTARRSRGRWPAPGGAPPSSTRSATARCCRSCTSTATRSAARPCWAARATRTSAPSCRATATRPTSSRATIRRACTRRSPRRSTGATSASAPSSTRPASTASSSDRAGRPSSCARPRAGRARRR